jgi:hypothetical protein
MTDPSAAVGLRGRPFEMGVERGKVREFARATHAPSSPYLEADQPPIPPTFLTVARLWQDAAANPWPAVGLDPRRVLHAEQEFVFHGPPPRSGTRLRGESRIERVYTKPGSRGELTFAVMVTEFYDVDDRLVAEARMTGLQTPAASA